MLKRMSILLLIFSNLIIPLSASHLSLYSYEPDGSFSIKEKVFMIFKDEQGRKVGYNPFTKERYEEIEGASIYSNTFDDIEGSPGPADFSIDFIEDIPNGIYSLQVFALEDTKYKISGIIDVEDYIVNNSTKNLEVLVTLETAPTITKTVTFQTLRDDFNVAQKLNQIGDDKFVNSLIRMVNIAEKLYNRCQQIKDDSKQDKRKRLCYRPVIMILELIKKRLEIVNRICDNPNECKMKCKDKDECDEEKVFENFRKGNIKEEGIKEFFSEWDKDEWHKHKKHCKKFVTDEALKIINEDIDWLIKSIDVEKDKQGK